MKLDKAITLAKESVWKEAQVRVSPGNRAQWFVVLYDSHNKSYVLAGNDDRAIATGDLNEFVPLAKSPGLKEFTIFL